MTHFTHKSGGPCWSKEKGYHQPQKLPDHIMRIIHKSKKKKKKTVKEGDE